MMIRSLAFVLASANLWGIAQGQIRIVAASPASISSFVQQGFEEKRFPPAGWTLDFTGDQHWSRYQGASGYGKGSGSALYNNLLIPAGTVQSLVLSSMARSVAGDSLRFDHAYTTYEGETDRLFIDVSGDGGATWTNLATLDGGKYGPLVTAPAQTVIFVPTSAQWATKGYALPPGTDRVRFKALSNYGNNLYLDNIVIGHPVSADVAVRSIEVPGTITTLTRSPGITVGNAGTSPATFTVTLLISPAGYSSVRTVTGLAAGRDTTVTCDAWAPSPGQNALTAYVTFPDDGDRSNDTLRATVVGTLPTIVSGIDAIYRSGQAFVTWNNLPTAGVRYTLYRSSSPINAGVHLAQAQHLGNVRDNSALNVRLTALSSGVSKYLKIDSASAPLAATRGLFVATSASQGTFYYAVTATLAGVEDTAIVAGSNATTLPLAESVAMPQPVWQEARAFGSRLADVYVQYATRLTSPSYPRMTNAGSYPFHLAVIRSGSGSSHPVTFCLHPSESNFLEAVNLRGIGDPDEWIVTIDDWLPNQDMETFYYGYHESYDIHSGNNPVPDNGMIAGYTAARVAHTVNWAIRYLPVDSTRTYMSGFSMGAIGSLLNGYMIPSKIAAILGVAPRINNTNWDWMQHLWGTPATDLPTDEGMLKSERLDATSLARRQRLGSLPVTFLFFGKQDINVGWAEKVPFIDSMNTYRHGTFIFWGNTNHSKTWSASPWAPGFPSFSFFTRYRTNVSYPAFSNCSLNSNPGNGDPGNGDPAGMINGYLDWNDDIVDTPNRWEITLKTIGRTTIYGSIAAPDTGTTDVTLRRLQKFAPPVDSMIVWKNIRDSVYNEETGTFEDGVAIQEDSLKYVGGPITIPAFQVFKTSSRLVVSWTITGVDNGLSLPSRCLLDQNFPNPFNPSTTIRYGLPSRAYVTLTVFNTLGQQVLVLQNGEEDAGYHNVTFDATSLSSGVYFYRLQAGNPSLPSGQGFVETKRLILLR
jgi:hypothetical protein